jgi:hypothetical protein
MVHRAVGLPVALLFIAPLAASELSTYRGLQLGMTISAVAKHIQVPVSEAKLIHKRPARIQELEWRPGGAGRSSANPDPAGHVRFTFCNEHLFRIVVTYDRELTRGMTIDDVVQAVSAQYGDATKPQDTEMVFQDLFTQTVKVLARWQDENFSISLLRSSYQPSFGLIFLSKHAERAAQVAIDEAVRLDLAEAPQRQAELQDRIHQETQAKERESRQTNKPNFRL